MRGNRVLGAGILSCFASLSITSCGSPAGVADGASPRVSADAATCAVRTDAEPLKKRFPQLGEPKRSQWCGIVLNGSDPRVPGPTDVRLVGIVEVTPEVMEEISGTDPSGFVPTVPKDVPSAVSEAFPEIRTGKWTESTRFDESVTRGQYTAGFSLNEAAHLILIDSVNPEPAGTASQAATDSAP